ncbi:lysine N(6)-hydroxylase/L-ornithine N(5)-oxygenase family protein [Streptomyces sp. NPDC056670]|uniref:lysine N(6)-hydroxylase/L-ornithine N(5)-oxygenase family protein n=1 Tax=Streptomyces sp. NPDC056670 TaxID=3345904 RepID=UPI0036AE891D
MAGESGLGGTTADVVGIGFGPANLALAIALQERSDAGALRARFFERQAEFGWHRGMLIDGATMQVPFLKDLATPRNPVSRFGFLSYLHARERMMDFLNRNSFFPLRTEFHDYLAWAADQFADQVDYGCEVVELRPVKDRDGVIRSVDVVVARQGVLSTVRTRAVVLASGLEPVLPSGVDAGDRVWHSSELLFRAEKAATGEPLAFVVVGAGQSAAEAVGFLHDRFPRAEVHAVFARYGFSVADSSSFANQVFDPVALDQYFGAPPEVKEMLFDYHANTNYSVVDDDLIRDLYDRVYREGLRGERRLHVHRVSRVRGHAAGSDGISVDIEFLPTGAVTSVGAEAIVYATGYRPGDPLALLGELGDGCLRDEQGRLRVGRDYRIQTADDLEAGIYLQGSTEHSHGISSSLLSNTAVRAGEIAEALGARR